MDDYQIEILPIAQKDMHEMVAYLNNFNSNTALSMYDEIITSIFSLKKFPNKQPQADIPILKAKGYRYLRVKRYLVFFVVADKKVQIRRVLHEKRNYKSILS